MNLARLKRIVNHRVNSLLREDRADAELAGELAFHFEALVRENLADGMSATDARIAARRKLGNIALLEEQCRDQRRVWWSHDLKQDVVYGWRMMRRNPGFTLVAAISLALGMGANTAVLGVADAMIFGPLPYRDPSRLTIIRTYSAENPSQLSNASLPDFFAIQDATHAFETMGCSLADQKSLGGEEDGRAPEKIPGQLYSPGMFETLGVEPLLGRVFRKADHHPGRASVVILSHSLWQRRFAADPKILGQRIRLDGNPVEVIGVMPPDFRFAEGQPEYWLPMNPARSSLQSGVRYYIAAARLRQGSGREQAQAELDRVAAQLSAEFPENHQGWNFRVQPIRQALFGWTGQAMLILEAAVLMVLLIACANVAGLLLARGASRRQEMAMRAALGAGRMRIVRQVLVESLMLSGAGAALGLALAEVILRALPAVHPPPGAPPLDAVPLNLHMLLLMGLTALLTALCFGIGPALSAFQQDLTGTLKESPRSSALPHARHRLRGALVAAQIAFAFIMSIGSGLLIKSFVRLSGRDLNFEPRGLLTAEFRLPTARVLRPDGAYEGVPYMAVDPAAAPKFQRMLDRLRQLAGVDSVAGISSLPVNAPIVPALPVKMDGEPTASGITSYFIVTPHFYATMRAPLIRGRDFDDADTAGSPWTAIVNETAARRFWPGDDPIGKHLTVDSGPDERPRQVIGVVRDVPTRTRQLEPEPVIYSSYLQQPPRYRLPWATMLAQMTFVLRTPDRPLAISQAVQQAASEIDADTPLDNVVPMEQHTGAWSSDTFYLTAMLGVFAAFATLLTAMGAYGVMASHVAQRTHEIGVRLALGARPVQILGLVGGRAAMVIVIGLAAGLAGARSLTRFLAPELWNVLPTDTPVFGGTLLFLGCVAVAACVGPLRRSIKVDPMRALRCE